MVPMLRFWLLALLQILAFVAANPSPKGGKGGSSDGDSSSSGDSSGSSGGSSSSSTPKGRPHTVIDGDKWPYRFPGSYYNGSMTLEVTIEHWPGCSEGTRRDMKADMDGILLLGPANQTGSFDDADPNFIIMGWDAGKIPANNWTDGEYWGNGGPGLTRWFSTDVKLMLSRMVEVWRDPSISGQPYDLGWQVDSQSSGNGTKEWQINGTFSGTSTTYAVRDNSEDNWMQITTLLCNNQTTVDVFNMQPWTGLSAAKDWPATQNTTFKGTFTPNDVSITWSGVYWGGFNSIDYGVPFAKTSYPQGYFRFTFDGKVDHTQSDELVARETALSGYYSSVGDADWIKKYDRSLNEPDKTTNYTNGAGRVVAPVAWTLLGALLGTVACILS